MSHLRNALLTAVFGLSAVGCAVPLPSTPAQRTAIKHYLPASYFDMVRKSGQGLGASIEGAPKVAERDATRRVFATLPSRVDLRPQCPPVYHQGPFRTCTGFAVAKGLGEYLLRRKGDLTPLSAVHLYRQAQQAGFTASQRQYPILNGMAAPNTEFEDLGAVIASAMATLEMGGAVAESASPYPPQQLWSSYWQSSLVPNSPEVASDPDAGDYGHISGYGKRPADPQMLPYFRVSAFESKNGQVRYMDATAKLRIKLAKRVGSLDAIKESLAHHMPVVAGFQIFKGFYGEDVAKTGRVPMPLAKEQALDGHAMLIVGYSDAERMLIVRNSWGATWGDKGYAYVPYAAVTQGLVRDAWTVGGE